MEKMLLKLANQLESLDEASLMALWSKYATLTSRFEPTRRWEEACLVFSLIQAKHWKNQLFNFCWSQQRQPEPPERTVETPEFSLEPEPEAKNRNKSCRVLAFRQAPEQAEEDLPDD